jgi:stage II sporulation protein P
MKQTSYILFVGAFRRSLQQFLFGMKLFFISVCSIAIFMLSISGGSYLYSLWVTHSPESSMKGLAPSVPSSFFYDFLKMELPLIDHQPQSFTFSSEKIVLFALRLLTHVNPHDPKTLLAAELPGMYDTKTSILRSSKAPNPSEPIDLAPTYKLKKSHDDQQFDTKSPTTPSPTPILNPRSSSPLHRVAFIYQTHSNESFLPELTGVTHPDQAYDDKTNITLVGKRLAEKLETLGVGAVHSDRIYPSQVKNFHYPMSYQYSLHTLKEAISMNPQLNYFFDIHRDSSSRHRTTINIQGVDYAQVYFIIGGKNASWKQNEAFANEIHQVLEQQYPGISKGIHAKSEKGSNGVFNQHFSKNSILIEIGGPYNSLAECYRTVDILASAISEVILQAKRVNVSE